MLGVSPSGRFGGGATGCTMKGRWACATDGLASPRPAGGGGRDCGAMLGLYAECYADFTVKHFHEQMVRRHHYKLGYTVTRFYLQRAGRVAQAPRRSAHRKKRARRPLTGMMLHQDASRYAWLPGVERRFDLVVTLDDATNAIYSAFLVDEEGTTSSFRGLIETIARNGIFFEFYTDRGSHYFFTPAAGEQSFKDTRDPGRPGLGAIGDQPHCSLFARGARSLRACLPHLAGPPAQGTGAGRDQP